MVKTLNNHQSFNVLFYKGNSLVGKLIKLISKSKSYSHCAFILDQWHCLEVAWNSPCVISHFKYRNGSYDIYKLNVDISEKQKKIISEYILDNISSGYDFLFVITRGLNFIFGTPIKNSKKTVSCDELIVAAFKEVGINLISDNEAMTPESLSKSKYLTKIN